MQDNGFGQTTPSPVNQDGAQEAPAATPAPTVSSGIDMQMGAASMPNGAENPEKTKSSLGIVLIIVLVLVAIGAVVATGFIAYNAGKNDNSVCSGNKDDKSGKDDSGDSGDEVLTDKAEKRNIQREDDLARVITAAMSYQANNNGKVPFGHDGAYLKNFIIRYIDSDCKDADYANGTFSSSCGDMFKDPQGETYTMVDKGSIKDMTFDSNDQIDLSGSIKNEKTFYAYTYAACGDDGKAKKSFGERDIAVFMKLEGGKIVYNDNH